MNLKMIINRAARKAQRFGGLDEYFFSLGIQAFSMDEFVKYLNNHGLEKDKVVVKTNSGYQDCRDDDYKPQGMVFLVIDAELMTKIAVLGSLPEVLPSDGVSSTTRIQAPTERHDDV